MSSSEVMSSNEWVTVSKSKKHPSPPTAIPLAPDDVSKKVEDRRLRRARCKETKKLRKEEEKRMAMFAPKDSKVRLVKALQQPSRKQPEEESTSWKLEKEAFPDLMQDKQRSYANSLKKKPEPAAAPLLTEPALTTKKKLGQPMVVQMKLAVKVKQSQLKKMKIISSKIVKNTSRSKNTLDSSAPIHLGKNQKARRKKKRPNKLKKIILKEKLQKKTLRELNSQVLVEGGAAEDSEGARTPEVLKGKKSPPPKETLHSKKFRSYCTHIRNKSLDEHVCNMVKDIIRWQDRAHAENPIRAKANRRYVIGLRETKKHIALSSIKLVIIATDLEPIKSEGGLDDAIEEIKRLCKEKSIPVVFSHPRRKLGYITYRKNPLACIGVMNYQGADEDYSKIMELLPSLSEEYIKKRNAFMVLDNDKNEPSTDNKDISTKMIEILKL